MHQQPIPQQIFPQLISTQEWQIYKSALDAVEKAQLRFLLGGAFSLAVHTGFWRDTKDLDLLILPEDRDRFVEVITEAGFEDYYDRLAYDRGWIYRSYRDGYIVDLIWQMANRRAQVSQDWFDHGTPVIIDNRVLYAVSPEELLWHKAYVMQRERCDWTDILNLLYAKGPTLDWRRIVKNFDTDGGVLNAILNMYNWLCPGSIRDLPQWLRKEFHLKEAHKAAPPVDEAHVRFMDSRPWFRGLQPATAS